MNKFNGIDNNFVLRKSQINNNNSISKNKTRSHIEKKSIPFQDIFAEKLNTKKISFSKHAVDRMRARKINLTELEIEKIEKAVEKAEKKGIKEALLVLEDNAFVASIENKKIITAVPRAEMNQNVFTNIDGAVII